MADDPSDEIEEAGDGDKATFNPDDPETLPDADTAPHAERANGVSKGAPAKSDKAAAPAGSAPPPPRLSEAHAAANVEDQEFTDVKVKPEISSEDDVVVRELDVYLSQTLANQLYLLQYPLRPPWRPYDPAQLATAKIKAKQQKLQMEYTIDQKSAHYDADSEIKLATHNLVSTKIDCKTTYAVAVLRGDQLHLTPIQGGIFQLRQSFSHSDEEDRKKKAEEEEENLAAHHEEDEEEEEPVPGAKPLTVQFKRRENERIVNARRQSHAFIKQQEEDEPWAEMKKYPRGSHVRPGWPPSGQAEVLTEACAGEQPDGGQAVRPDQRPDQLRRAPRRVHRPAAPDACKLGGAGGGGRQRGGGGLLDGPAQEDAP